MTNSRQSLANIIDLAKGKSETSLSIITYIKPNKLYLTDFKIKRDNCEFSSITVIASQKNSYP